MRGFTLVLLALTGAPIVCAAAPTLTPIQIKEIGNAEGVTSIWRTELSPQRDDEVDFFLFFYSPPEHIAAIACTTHETILGVKVENGVPKVVDRNEQDRLALHSCAKLKPEDFSPVSSNAPSASLSEIAELVREGITSSDPRAHPGKVDGLRACLNKSPQSDLSSLTVHSMDQVSANFYTTKKKGCPAELTLNITRGTDRAVAVAFEPGIGSYTKEK